MATSKNYSHYAIIYNPNSTGSAPAIAKEVRDDLIRVTGSNENIILLPTKRAKHAITLAKDTADKYTLPLIISVSGDGGYNEVVNGVLSSKNSQAVATVVGAGNANDHYRVVHNRRTIQEMLTRNPSPIDLLKVSVKSGDNLITTHAHSYIGIGLTPLIAEELNRNKLNPIKEIRIITKALVSIRPTKIKKSGEIISIDSLVFANISQMAKVLTLTDDNSLHDGQFEIVEIMHTSVFGLLKTLLLAATIGLTQQPKQKQYQFILLEDHPLQVDGEIIQCSKNDEVLITVAKDALMTLR